MPIVIVLYVYTYRAPSYCIYYYSQIGYLSAGCSVYLRAAQLSLAGLGIRALYAFFNKI